VSFSSVTKSIELEKQEEYIGMGIPWYFIYNASNFPLYYIKFLEMCFEKIEEQYSICDLYEQCTLISVAVWVGMK